MIKHRIQQCYDNIRPEKGLKDQVLVRILAKRPPARGKRWLPWAAAASVLAAAALAVVLITGNAGFHPAKTAVPGTVAAPSAALPDPASGIVCRVMMRINPKVEFQIGADGMVVNVVGLNDDGIELVRGIDFAGLSMENATIIVVNRLIEENYITASMVDDVYITVSGTTLPDTLTMMSGIIKTAASQYDLSVDTVQTQENELQVVMGDADTPAVTDSPGATSSPVATPSPEVSASPEVSPAPPVDPQTLPVVLKLKYISDSDKTVRNIYVYPKDKEKIDNLVDFAGMYVNEATLWCFLALRQKEYLSDGMADGRAVFDLSDFGADVVSQTEELLGLVVQDECLPYSVVMTGEKEISLVPSALPPAGREGKYTLAEVWDVTVNKSLDDLTPRQKRILSLVFTDEKQLDDLLRPRYWVVLPDLVGLQEARAMELCRLSGLQPLVHYTTEGEGPVGTVVYQDIEAGQLWEAGTRWDINVKTENVPEVSYTKDDIPSDIEQYLPSFLTDPEGTMVSIERGGEDCLPFRLGRDWEVELHAYGGGITGQQGQDTNWRRVFTNDPDKTLACWDPEYGDGDDIPWRAALTYYVYRDGKVLASVAIKLELVDDEGNILTFEDIRGGYNGKTLRYKASLAGFAEGRKYSFDGFMY